MMSPLDYLKILLQTISFEDTSEALLNTAKIQSWPPDIVKQLESQNLIERIYICSGCEKKCAAAIPFVPDPDYSKPIFSIHCELFLSQDENYLLSQNDEGWRISRKLIISFIQKNLSIDNATSNQDSQNQSPYKIGYFTEKKKTKLLQLEFINHTPYLVAGTIKKKLTELLTFHNNEYQLNKPWIKQMVDYSCNTTKGYIPNQIKQNKRKLATQKKYRFWVEEFKIQKKLNPKSSNVKTAQAAANRLNKKKSSDEDDIVAQTLLRVVYAKRKNNKFKQS